MTELLDPVLGWYAEHQRDLPWRRPTTSAWGVMVSEFMLQQTPVARVLPVWEAWLSRWPDPTTLAASPSGEAVREWGRLGYPRRALRLHAAATTIRDEHGGIVPSSYDVLRSLPGVGDYTAAAIASFAYGRRHVVLDTNVRRVLARACNGLEFPAASVTRAERDLAASMLPPDDAPGTAALWSVAVMELGALICTASSPTCGRCPITDRCAWQLGGAPAYDGPPRKGQTYAGTDRQVRGRLLAVIRESDNPVPKHRLDTVWHLHEQRERALGSLLADGLIAEPEPGFFTLPG